MQILNTALFVYSFVMLAAIYASSRPTKYALTSDKLFRSLLKVTLLLLVTDLLARVDGLDQPFYPVFTHVGNFLSYGIGHVIPSLWFLFIHYRIYSDTERNKALYKYFWVISGINVLLLVITQFTGWYYTIDSQNMYHRGPLFLWTTFVNFIILIAALALLIIRRHRIEKENIFAYFLFSLIPASGLIVQALLPGIAYIPNSIALALVILYLFVQNNRVRYDHLTGIFNRRQMDFYLEDKLIGAKKGKAFAAILLDLDDFKLINDRLGHSVGDEAIKKTARLLTKSIGKTEFLSRYGGDEFLIITSKSTQEQIDEIICNIYKEFEAFNQKHRRFSLSISYGYFIYTPEHTLTREEFIDIVDRHMYTNKTEKKLKTIIKPTKVRKENSN